MGKEAERGSLGSSSSLLQPSFYTRLGAGAAAPPYTIKQVDAKSLGQETGGTWGHGTSVEGSEGSKLLSSTQGHD